MNENEKNAAELSGAGLGHFEAAFVEPFVEHAVKKAREYNRLFQETTINEEERKQIQDELDQDLSPIHRVFVEFTGRLHIIADGVPDLSINQPVYLEDTEIVANGFYITPVPQRVAGEVVGEYFQVFHHFLVRVQDVYGNEALDGDDPNRLVECLAELDSFQMEIPGVSFEHSKSALSLFHPGFVEEIDTRLLNGSGREDDAVLSLRGLDINEHIESMDDRTRMWVDTYINHLLQLDTKVPYSLSLKGLAVRCFGEDTYQAVSMDVPRALGIVTNVAVRPESLYEEGETKRWELAADVDLLSTDRNQESAQLSVPLKAVAAMQSVRNAYFGG